MAKKADRVIIDTNLWISFLITRDFKALDSQIKEGKIRVIFSSELIREFLSIANRPKFKKYFSKEDIEQLIDLFEFYGEIVQVENQVELCRDPKDDFLLSLAIESNANYLITGDNDLLDMKVIHKTKIITMANYLDRINK